MTPPSEEVEALPAAADAAADDGVTVGWTMTGGSSPVEPAAARGLVVLVVEAKLVCLERDARITGDFGIFRGVEIQH